MREIDELVTLIKSDPKSIVDMDWAEETNDFDIPRMHELVLKLNDIDLIDSVTKMIVAEWELLLSQDDPRCYNISDKGKEEKFPDRTDFSDGPIVNKDLRFIINVSAKSITGVLYLCKEEVLRQLRPIWKHQATKAKLIEKYSQPSESSQDITPQIIIPDPVKLHFFNKNLYVTADEQEKLRVVLRSELHNIDKTSGREWFVYYAAYRYVQNSNKTMKGYVDFFTDIEKLIPDSLPEVNINEERYPRYKHYTTQLKKEVDHWYVDEDKLPPINNLLYSNYHFGCSEDAFDQKELIIKRLFNRFHSLEDELKRAKGIN